MGATKCDNGRESGLIDPRINWIWILSVINPYTTDCDISPFLMRLRIYKRKVLSLRKSQHEEERQNDCSVRKR